MMFRCNKYISLIFFGLLAMLTPLEAQGEQASSAQKLEQLKAIANKEKSKEKSGRPINNKKEDDVKPSPNYRMSLGIFSGYTLSNYQRITDDLLFQKPSASTLPEFREWHTFNLGVRTEIELSSWSSLKTELYVTQTALEFAPLLVEGRRGLTSQYFLLDLLFQIKFFWRISNFKLSFAIGLGPTFTLSKPELFDIKRQPSNLPFMVSELLSESSNNIGLMLSESLSIEYTIHPQMSLFLTGSYMLGVGQYRSDWFGGGYFAFPISIGVNRLFAF